MRKNFFFCTCLNIIFLHIIFAKLKKKVRTIYTIFKQQMCFFILIGKWLFYDSSILFLQTVLLKWKNCLNNDNVVCSCSSIVLTLIVRSAPPKLFEKIPTQIDFILLGKQSNYRTFFLILDHCALCADPLFSSLL